MLGLHSARDLPAVDGEVFGGKKWSDPRVRFVVKAGEGRGELSVTSRVVEKELNPVWRQPFAVAAAAEGPEGDWSLEVLCVVEDEDKVSAADFMGQVTLRLRPHEVAGGRWRALEDPKGELVLG